MNFKNLAYAKLNVDFDVDLFSKEYDEKIFPTSSLAANPLFSVKATTFLNKVWKMVPEEEYNKISVAVQPHDQSTYQYLERERPCWRVNQLMYLDTTGLDDPLLLKFGPIGRGPSIRNETLDVKYNWKIKPEFENLEIVKWINENLPFENILTMHCVSTEPGGFVNIHRDSKGFYSSASSAGINKLYKRGFVVINLNITDGGSPLYWSLDGEDSRHCFKANDRVYITNDYFPHGVGIVSTRRRQIRVTGIPKPEMWDLFVPESIMTIPDDYKYDLNVVQK